MNKEKFIELMKETIEIENDVNLNDKFREYEEWDSLAVLSVLAMINDEYDIIIPRTEFENALTVQDLWDIIQNKKIRGIK